MTDIEELLERAADGHSRGFTTADVEQRVRRRIRRRRAAASLTVLVLLGIGVAGAAALWRDRDQVPVATAPSPSVDLVGGTWVVVEMSGQERITGDVHVEFRDDGSASGYGGCNGIGLQWSVQDGRLVIERQLSSMRGCETLAGYEIEEQFFRLLDGGTIERSEANGDEIVLRKGDEYAVLARQASAPPEDEPAEPGEVVVTEFQVLLIGEYRIEPIGRLGSATDDAELQELWESLAFDGVADRGLAEVPRPEVDFDRQVVVSVTIPDDACPPELVRFDVDGRVLIPVFVQPPGGCREPLIPKVYVVALSHEFAPPGSVLRYPDDPELQQGREGPREIPIWSAAGTSSDTVEVHFASDDVGRDCAATTPVTRSITADLPVTTRLAVALRGLLAGPTAEERDAGLTSWFSEETAEMLWRVEVGDGVAHVDFADLAPLLNNASTSCGSASLLSSLDRTVTQFPEVEMAVYYFAGDADAFYYWLQGEPPPEARPEVFGPIE